MITLKSLLLAALVVATATSHSVLAQEDKAPTTNWTGGGDGKSWSQGSNWSTGHAPTAEEIVSTNGAEITVKGVNNEAALISLAKTTLTIEAGAELHVVGHGSNISQITGESEICVHGKLLLNTAIYSTKSTVTVDGSGMIEKETGKSMAFLQHQFILNLVGDKAEINNFFLIGGQAEMNLTLGPSGIDPIDMNSLELGDTSTLTVDVSKYKPKSKGTSVTLFSFRGVKGQFASVNVTGGTGTIQYTDKDVTLSDIVVKP